MTTSTSEMKMRGFVVENLSDRALKLGIEPWADSEVLQPRDKVLFEYEENDEPVVIEFSIMKGDRVVVGIVSDVIKITGRGGEKVFRTNPAN